MGDTGSLKQINHHVPTTPKSLGVRADSGSLEIDVAKGTENVFEKHVGGCSM